MKTLSALATLLLCVALSQAAPPNFNPPEELKPVSGVALYAPPEDCVSVVYIGLSGEEPFPLGQVGGNKTAFFFLTRGLPEGRYKFVGVATNDKGEQVRKDFAVVVGKPKDPPKDPPVCPKDPPTEPVKGFYYFLIVRPDGAATPAFTRVMRFTEWDQLTAAGMPFKDKTKSEAALLGVNVTEPLPVVVVLKVSADGKKSERVAVEAFPNDATGIAALRDKYRAK